MDHGLFDVVCYCMCDPHVTHQLLFLWAPNFISGTPSTASHSYLPHQPHDRHRGHVQLRERRTRPPAPAPTGPSPLPLRRFAGHVLPQHSMSGQTRVAPTASPCPGRAQQWLCLHAPPPAALSRPCSASAQHVRTASQRLLPHCRFTGDNPSLVLAN